MKSSHIIKTPEWNDIFRSLPVIRGFFAGDPDSHGINELLRGISIYFEKMLHGADNGRPFVWYNLGFNSELIYALDDVCPLAIESLGVMHNLVGDIDVTLDFIDGAQAAGVPADCCSADKLAIGAMRRGLYPPPACAVAINTPCDSQVMATQVMAEAFRSGKLGVMDYYRMENIQADTAMRGSIAHPEGKK